MILAPSADCQTDYFALLYAYHRRESTLLVLSRHYSSDKVVHLRLSTLYKVKIRRSAVPMSCKMGLLTVQTALTISRSVWQRAVNALRAQFPPLPGLE